MITVSYENIIVLTYQDVQAQDFKIPQKDLKLKRINGW